MNFNLSKLAEQCEKLPFGGRQLRNLLIGKYVGYVGNSLIDFQVLSKEKVVIHLANKPKIRNHIKQVHAMASALAIETATGFVLTMNLPDDKVPLLKSINLNFVRRSQGAITATATIDPEYLPRIHSEEKADLPVNCVITDESGHEPITAQVVWAFVPKKKIK